jgi:hypothetical protein
VIKRANLKKKEEWGIRIVKGRGESDRIRSSVRWVRRRFLFFSKMTKGNTTVLYGCHHPRVLVTHLFMRTT